MQWHGWLLRADDPSACSLALLSIATDGERRPLDAGCGTAAVRMRTSASPGSSVHWCTSSPSCKTHPMVNGASSAVHQVLSYSSSLGVSSARGPFPFCIICLSLSHCLWARLCLVECIVGPWGIPLVCGSHHIPNISEACPLLLSNGAEEELALDDPLSPFAFAFPKRSEGV